MEDTSKARTEGSKTVFKADAHNGLHLYDLEAFFKCQQGAFINPKANSPDNAYVPFEQPHLAERVKAILRPHRVTFYDKAKHPYAEKHKDDGSIQSSNGTPRQEAALLQQLNDTSASPALFGVSP